MTPAELAGPYLRAVDNVAAAARRWAEQVDDGLADRACAHAALLRARLEQLGNRPH